MKKYGVINIASLIKAKQDNINIINDFDEMKERLEAILLPELKNVGIHQFSIYQAPYFVTGKSMADMDTFNPKNSDWYQSSDVLNVLLSRTSDVNGEDASFGIPIKNEHIPSSRHEKLKEDEGGDEDQIVAFRFSIVLNEGTKEIHKSPLDLTVNEAIDNAIKAFLAMYVIDMDYIGSVVMSPETKEAQELVFKIIQHQYIMGKLDDSITRVEGTNIVNIGYQNNKTSFRLNDLYIKNKIVYLPYFTFEDFGQLMAYMERSVGCHIEDLSPEDINKMRGNYFSILMGNSMQMLSTKKTLESLGYKVAFVRADTNYVAEGNVTDVIEMSNLMEGYEADKNISPDIVGFSLRSNQSTKFEKVVLTPNIVISSYNAGTIRNEDEQICLSMHASYVSEGNVLISIDNVYGDFNSERMNGFIDSVRKNAEEQGAEFIYGQGLHPMVIKDSITTLISSEKQ